MSPTAAIRRALEAELKQLRDVCAQHSATVRADYYQRWPSGVMRVVLTVRPPRLPHESDKQ